MAQRISFLSAPLLGASLSALQALGLTQVPTFPSSSELVVLSATAVDSHGRPVTNLKAQELRVSEEGRPQEIIQFMSGAEAPARLLVLVDASGSMNGKLKATSAAMVAKQVLAALGPGDQVALAAFDGEYRSIVSWTTDRESLEEALSGLKAFGATALHDALDLAALELSIRGEGRRAVLVITDGVDTASKETPEAVINRSQALDVPIYAVSVVSSVDDPRSGLHVGGSGTPALAAGMVLLDRYASLSGGAAFVVSDFAGLKRAADLIALELKHQYRLGYNAPDGPTYFRRVEVRTTRKGVSVRTRSGYVPGRFRPK